MKINKLIGQFCFLLWTAIILIACNSQTKENQTQISRETLAQGFITPADSVQTAVYWYWISDNISKDGVVKDLHAMKKAGINRAFIGNIGLDDVAYGKVKMLSEVWWEILHIALKTATELNIEIGIFNSPGWSQSGGPWVKAENAMRYLTASETKVKGPAQFSQKLEKPIDLFQDVKVLAYPAPKDNDLLLSHKNARISTIPQIKNTTSLTDGDITTGFTFPEGDTFTINLEANKAFTARSLSLKSTNNSIYSNVQLQAKDAHPKCPICR